jgi:hypothetical protein
LSNVTIIEDTDWKAPCSLPPVACDDAASTIRGFGWTLGADYFLGETHFARRANASAFWNSLHSQTNVFTPRTHPFEKIDSGQATKEQESPFDQLLDHSVTLAMDAIEELVGQLDGFEPCADRLRELTKMAVEEYPEARIPAVVSISTFGRFVKLYPNLKRPTISLLPSGGLWLSWSSDHVRAALGIARDGQATFGLVSKRPNQRPVHFNLAGSIEEIAPEIHGSNRSRWIWE